MFFEPLDSAGRAGRTAVAAIELLVEAESSEGDWEKFERSECCLLLLLLVVSRGSAKKRRFGVSVDAMVMLAGQVGCYETQDSSEEQHTSTENGAPRGRERLHAGSAPLNQCEECGNGHAGEL